MSAPAKQAPPVPLTSVRLVGELELAEGYRLLARGAAGGIATFVGTVREQTAGRTVTSLHFEAYEPMAIRELQKIADAACTSFNLAGALLWHALGSKLVGEPVVLVGAAAPHRDAAFRACRYLIDTLKQNVPIWKREHFADGSHWVNAHP